LEVAEGVHFVGLGETLDCTNRVAAYMVSGVYQVPSMVDASFAPYLFLRRFVVLSHCPSNSTLGKHHIRWGHRSAVLIRKQWVELVCVEIVYVFGAYAGLGALFACIY